MLTPGLNRACWVRIDWVIAQRGSLQSLCVTATAAPSANWVVSRPNQQACSSSAQACTCAFHLVPFTSCLSPRASPLSLCKDLFSLGVVGLRADKIRFLSIFSNTHLIKLSTSPRWRMKKTLGLWHVDYCFKMLQSKNTMMCINTKLYNNCNIYSLNQQLYQLILF